MSIRLAGAIASSAINLMRSMGGLVRKLISHANDRTNDARSSTSLYGSPDYQRGDQKSSVPTLICNTASELFTKQLRSKSFRCNSLLTTNMLSGLISLCNTPVMCKPVTACKSPVKYCHMCGDTSPVTRVACNAKGNATPGTKQSVGSQYTKT